MVIELLGKRNTKARMNLIATVVTGPLVAIVGLAKRIEVIIDMKLNGSDCFSDVVIAICIC